MSENYAILDFDAAMREVVSPDGIKLPYKGVDYILPAEFPIDVLDPLLDPELDLAGVIKLAVQAGTSGDMIDNVLDILLARPNLPRAVLDAFHDAFRKLFGVEPYDEFLKTRPGVKTYSTLIRVLSKEYGISLGESFASPESSADAGETPKQTSPSTTQDSTPEASSDVQVSEPASSVPDA